MPREHEVHAARRGEDGLTMATKQILLNAKACSGRGVRIEILSGSAIDEIVETELRALGPDGLRAQLEKKVVRAGIASMIRAVTEKSGFSKQDELVSASWKPVARKDLEDNLDAFFNAADQTLLEGVYTRLHVVTEGELDNVMGEALPVAED